MLLLWTQPRCHQAASSAKSSSSCSRCGSCASPSSSSQEGPLCGATPGPQDLGRTGTPDVALEWRRASPSADTEKLLREDFPAWQHACFRVTRVVKFSKPGPVVSHHGVIYHIRTIDNGIFYLQVELLTQGIRHNLSSRDPLALVDTIGWSVAREVDLSPSVVREHLEAHLSHQHSYLGWNCQDFAEELLSLAETRRMPVAAHAHRMDRQAAPKRRHRNAHRRRYEFYIMDGWPNRLWTRLRRGCFEPWGSCSYKAGSRGLLP